MSGFRNCLQRMTNNHAADDDNTFFWLPLHTVHIYCLSSHTPVHTFMQQYLAKQSSLVRLKRRIARLSRG